MKSIIKIPMVEYGIFFMALVYVVGVHDRGICKLRLEK